MNKKIKSIILKKKFFPKNSKSQAPESKFVEVLLWIILLLILSAVIYLIKERLFK
jgi:hypothetical protein